MEEHASYRKFTKNIGIISLANLFLFVEGMVILPVITKVLGAENYGIWTQLSMTINLGSQAIILGLPYALIRFLPAEEDKRKIQEGIYSVLVLVFIIALTAAIFLFLFSGSVAKFFQCPPILIKILGFIILFECLNFILLRIFHVFQEIAKYSFLAILKISVELALIIAAVLLGYGLYGAVLSLLVARILFFITLLWSVVKKIGIKVPDFSQIKKYLSFGLPTFFSSISYWIVTSGDKYLIGYFMGVLFVGYYSPGYAIGNIINFLIYPLVFMLPVVLSKSFDKNEPGEVKTYLKYSLKYFLMIAIPSVFGLSILSKQLLTVFSTKEISSNGYFVTPFVATSILLYGVCAIFDQILYLHKKTKLSGTIWMIAALLNIVLNLLLIPALGILGAAMTTLLAYVFAFFLTWHYSSKNLQFDIDWQSILKSILASVLMVIFIVWFNPTSLLNIILAIISGVFIYGLLVWVMQGIDKKEFEFLKSLLKELNL